MVRAPRKALKIGRAALKTAARLPAKVAVGGSGRNNFSPLPGEKPIVILKVQVLSCQDLLAKDRNGFSDPFVVVSVLGDRRSTAVVKRTLNPTYNAKDATFDFPIYLSTAEKLGVVELVVWDKDVIRKDYLGEVSIPLEDWFRDDRALGFTDPNNKPHNLNLVSTRTSTPASGSIQIKLGFERPSHIANLMEYSEVYNELVKLSRPSLVSAPPTEGIGTVRSTDTGSPFADDGLSSDEGESDTEEEDEDVVAQSGSTLTDLYVPPSIESRQTTITPSTAAEVEQPTPLPASEAIPPPIATPLTPTQAAIAKTPTGPKPPSPFSIPKIFPRRPATSRSSSIDSVILTSPPSGVSTTPATSITPSASTSALQRPEGGKGKKFRKSFARQGRKTGYHLNPDQDILGIVMLEIKGATDLPRLRNLTRLGWDMDPFVVVSFGKKVFRTRVIRHSLNPSWDEKLLFHVRRYEATYKIQFSVLDWDKLSSNDHVGDATFDVAKLIDNALRKDPNTGLYPDEEDYGMKELTLPLSTAKEMPWETKHNPVLTVRAKYQPYDALRQRFWRQVLKQYDTDDTRTISRIEMTSMLDSLNSTLSHSTIDSFFTRFNKEPHSGTLTFDEAIQCLETELCRPTSEKKRITAEDISADSSVPLTPANFAAGQELPTKLNLDKLDFSGPVNNQPAPETEPLQKPAPLEPYTTEPNQQTLTEAIVPALADRRPAQVAQLDRQISASSSDAEESSGSSGSSSPADDSFERVINVKNCPLCHKPRLSSKAEVDIVTHLAICASQDWERVDRLLVGNFVTANQAQRKWYTKVLSKVSAGDYRLGANSANIIVQNRMTGQLEEEKMQAYVRLGIRLLYKGWKSRMEGARARKLLRSMSFKQGTKYDSPDSARDIPQFIEFHKLNVDEILDPLDSFRTFNEFFYRKLKPDARPTEEPDNPYRLVSGADCRLMVFETVQEATRLWIKGREFSVARLLGSAYKSEADLYNGGSLCIFRLAPQDYHRFHSPVDGVIGPMVSVGSEYYTVNPQAIRSALDVYGENVRTIVPIDSPQFGRVMAVCIGAMMVGSIKITVQEGQEVKRGDEFGYFAFGGSTIVVLFEKGVVEWDEDLVINSQACLETLVRVGMGIGRGRRAPQQS